MAFRWRYRVTRWTFLLLGLVLASTAAADSVEIPLPTLTGDYDAGLLPPDDAPSSRSTVFTIPSKVAAMLNMSVEMSGTSQDGWFIRETDIGGGQVQLDTLSVPTSMRLFLRAPTLDDRCFFGVVSLPAPDFAGESAWIVDCDPGDPLDLNLLLDTTIEAELVCYFSPLGDPYVDPLATLTDVRLIISGEIVAGARGTWGMIKAQYR
jgi:hypothetical protein